MNKLHEIVDHLMDSKTVDKVIDTAKNPLDRVTVRLDDLPPGAGAQTLPTGEIILNKEIADGEIDPVDASKLVHELSHALHDKNYLDRDNERQAFQAQIQFLVEKGLSLDEIENILLPTFEEYKEPKEAKELLKEMVETSKKKLIASLTRRSHNQTLTFTPEEKAIIDQVKAVAEKLGITAYLAGGLIRDRLVGKDNDDLDFVTNKGSDVLAKALAKRYKLPPPVKLDRSGATMIHIGNKNIDIIDAEKVFTPLKTANQTLEKGQEGEMSIFLDDAFRRDLTINSLMYNIHTGELLDPTGKGLSDLENRIIRTIIDPNLKYRVHAPDMLRALRFYATGDGYKFAPGMLEAMKANAERVTPRDKGGDISARRIERELRKAFKNSAQWAKMKSALAEVGLYDYIGKQIEDVDKDRKGDIDYNFDKKASVEYPPVPEICSSCKKGVPKLKAHTNDFPPNTPATWWDCPECKTTGLALHKEEPEHEAPLDELINEHERLVDVLESPSHEDDLEELKEQKKELEEYKKEYKQKKEAQSIRDTMPELDKAMHPGGDKYTHTWGQDPRKDAYIREFAARRSALSGREIDPEKYANEDSEQKWFDQIVAQRSKGGWRFDPEAGWIDGKGRYYDTKKKEWVKHPKYPPKEETKLENIKPATETTQTPAPSPSTQEKKKPDLKQKVNDAWKDIKDKMQNAADEAKAVGQQAANYTMIPAIINQLLDQLPPEQKKQLANDPKYQTLMSVLGKPVQNGNEILQSIGQFLRGVTNFSAAYLPTQQELGAYEGLMGQKPGLDVQLYKGKDWEARGNYNPKDNSGQFYVQKTFSIKSFTKRAQQPNDAFVQGPDVQIDPSLQNEIKDAVNDLRKADPGFFKGVSKIVALTGGPFGQVSSKDPTTVNLNLTKIKQEVQRQLGGQYNSSNPEHKKVFDEAVKRSIVETIAHETGHVRDFDPENNTFPGGEGSAESLQSKMMNQLQYNKPIDFNPHTASIRTAVLVQKVNPNTGTKQWALVSKKDHSKVLEWYSSEKPSKDRVQKTEKRVQYFKHKKSGILSFTKKATEEVSTVAVVDEDNALLMAPRKDDGKWTLPGGHLESGEDPAQGAVRELFEETAIDLDKEDLNYLGSKMVSKPDGEQVKVHSFIALSDEQGDSSGDPDSELEEWVSVPAGDGLPDDIKENLHNGDNDVTLQFLGLQEKTATDYAGRDIPNDPVFFTKMLHQDPNPNYAGGEVLKEKEYQRKKKTDKLKELKKNDR